MTALQAFQTWEVIQINRCENVDVDMLAHLRVVPSLKEGRWVRVENQSSPSTTSANTIEITTKEDWRMSIKNFIDKGLLPKEEMEKGRSDIR